MRGAIKVEESVGSISISWKAYADFLEGDYVYQTCTAGDSVESKVVSVKLVPSVYVEFFKQFFKGETA